ncbi:MAG: DUF504 domain-containing protein [Thermoplasmata archaeon]|jgi:uncharacterized protein (UPF0248 family)|nr:DUF504 domain-containing protein [Thermoplasmata archaeon]
MVYPRDVLNMIRWSEEGGLAGTTVWYVHRGAPDDRAKVDGAAICQLGSLFFETADASIPYHRVLRIDHKGRTLFERKGKAGGTG